MSEPSAATSSHIRALLQVVLVVATVAAALWLVYRLAAVIFVLIGAALFAYVIAPLVQRAQGSIRIGGSRIRLPRSAAIAVVYVALAGSVAAGAVVLLPVAVQQASEMVSGAPASSQAFLAWEHGWSRYYERLRIPIPLRRGIDQAVLAAGTASVDATRRSLLSLARGLSNLPWLLLIPILAFFLLKDATSIRRDIVTALPHRLQLRGHRLFEDLNAAVAAYIRAQLLACLLVGTVCGVGFALLGVPYAVALGVLAGMLEFIPLVGPLLLAVIGAVVAWLHAPMLAAWTIGFLGALRIVEDYAIYPRLIRRGLSLHPLAVITAVLAGAELSGLAGMFLAVPAVAVASVVMRHVVAWRAEGLASDTGRPA
jgi:predicted PurR-regulated permease PerM